MAKRKIDTRKAKKRLQTLRAEIERLDEITVGDRKPVELDQQTQGRLSRMDAMQVQEMALEQERRRDVELQRIDAALKRITDREYGYCAMCGEEIAAARLENDPAVALCVDCAQG